MEEREYEQKESERISLGYKTARRQLVLKRKKRENTKKLLPRRQCEGGEALVFVVFCF